ncbi:MAG: ferrochelatase [Nitrospiraceae bacterium]
MCERLGTQPTRFAFQSQGRSGEKWLGPTVEDTLAELEREGHRHVLVAPIGFICDHVETLFDIDIELKRLAQTKGMQPEPDPHVERRPGVDRYFDGGVGTARGVSRGRLNGELMSRGRPIRCGQRTTGPAR